MDSELEESRFSHPCFRLLYWYDGVLEALVKGEKCLCDDKPGTLVNID